MVFFPGLHFHSYISKKDVQQRKQHTDSTFGSWTGLNAYSTITTK